MTWGWDDTGKYLQDGQVLDWIICVSQDITRRHVRSKLTNRPLNATCPLAYVVLRPWNWWVTRSVRTNLTAPRTATSTGHTISQETPRILWDTKVHRRFHKSLPLDIVLRRISPIHILILRLLHIVVLSRHLLTRLQRDVSIRSTKYGFIHFPFSFPMAETTYGEHDLL